MDITGSTGIIIQEVTNIHFFANKWHLLSYVNITLIEENHTLLRTLIQDLSYLCKNSRRILRRKIMEFENICDPVRNKLVMYMLDLDKLNYLFYSIPRSLDKSIFPEETSYEHVYKHVQEIKNSPSKFLNDNQNKTTYFQNWFNLQQTTSENFIGHLELLQDEIHALETEVTALNNSEKVNYILHPVLNRFQKTLVFALALIEKHYVSMSMIQRFYVSGINYIDFEYFVPILQFRNLLLHIKEKIETNTGLHLIIDADSHFVRKYYKLLQIDTIFIRELIVFQITIPFVENESYTYYKAVPFPIRLTYNLFAFVVPQYTYLALNIRENLMMPLEVEALKDCIEYNGKQYCEETTITYNVSERKICEVEIIKTAKVPDYCNYRLVHSNYDLFFPLHRPNSWSYTLVHGSGVVSRCIHSSTLSFSIPNQGVMSIPPHCTLQINGFYINVQKYHFVSPLRFIIPEHYDYEIEVKMLKIDNLRIDNIPVFDVPVHQRNNMKMLIAGSIGLHDIITEKVLISYRYSFFEFFVISFSFIVAILLSPFMVFKFIKCIAMNGTVDELVSDSYRNLRQDNLVLDTQV